MEFIKIQISKTDGDANQEYSIEIPLVDMDLLENLLHRIVGLGQKLENDTIADRNKNRNPFAEE